MILISLYIYIISPYSYNIDISIKRYFLNGYFSYRLRSLFIYTYLVTPLTLILGYGRIYDKRRGLIVEAKQEELIKAQLWARKPREGRKKKGNRLSPSYRGRDHRDREVCVEICASRVSSYVSDRENVPE